MNPESQSVTTNIDKLKKLGTISTTNGVRDYNISLIAHEDLEERPELHGGMLGVELSSVVMGREWFCVLSSEETQSLLQGKETRLNHDLEELDVSCRFCMGKQNGYVLDGQGRNGVTRICEDCHSEFKNLFQSEIETILENSPQAKRLALKQL